MKKLSILITIFLFILVGCNQPYGIKEFDAVNQNGEKFGIEDLKGQVWIADFIFTSCETICPPMTANMATLQKKFKDKNLDVQFISFSVDPTVDSPEVLKKYMKIYSDDESNWNMLTGYTQKHIETFAREEFQTLVQKPKSTDQVLHGVKFYLIDKNGKIVNEYNFSAGNNHEELIQDAEDIL